MKRALLYLSSIIIISLFTDCIENKEKNNDVFFFIDDVDIVNKSMISFRIINNSNKNYFIMLDTTRSNRYYDFNIEINNCILLQTNIYDKYNNLISLNGRGSIYKPTKLDKRLYDCIEESIKFSKIKYKNFVNLNGGIILNKKSELHLKIPFELRYESCNFTYFYPLKKDNNYFFQIEYKMLNSTLKKYANKTKLDSLKKNCIYPYYNKIISNKVPIKFD